MAMFNETEHSLFLQCVETQVPQDGIAAFSIGSIVGVQVDGREQPVKVEVSFIDKTVKSYLLEDLRLIDF
jgi:hypothetical protein